MHSHSGIDKVFLLGVISLVLATGSATALNIGVMGEPLNNDYVSNDTDTVRMVNITDNGEPLDSEDVGNDFHVNFTYNATSGETMDLEHLANGYWYADFTPDENRGSFIEYRIEEKAGTEDKASTTEELGYGNYSLELMSDVGDRISPDESINLRVNVTDEAGGEPETNADVTAYFTNGSETLNIQGLNNQDGSEYYNSEVNTPSNYGGNYILHINASNSGESHVAPEGALSVPVSMEPPMTGDIEYLDSPAGCNNSSFFNECEREAEISTGYNITGAVPDSVNFSIEMKNRSSGKWEEHSSVEMQNNSIYEAETTLPDLNNTAYEREIRLVYNATGSEADAVKTYGINIRDYQIKFGAATSARQGGEYNLELAFEKYFSSQPLDSSRMDAEINVTNSTHTLREYTLEDMEYSDGVFQRDVEVGADWPEGTYGVHVEAEDVYSNNETADDSFFVQQVDRTFNITEEIDEEVVTAGEYEFNLTVENLKTSELNLTLNGSEDLDGFTETPGFSVIEGEEEKDIPVQFNFTGTRMEDRSGEIILEDEGGFNDSADVDLDIPDCDYRDGAYCVQGELNSSKDERGYSVSEMDLYYLANQSDEADVVPEAEGNISDVLSFQPSTAGMNSSNNEQIFIANFSAITPGYFTGSVNVGTVSIPVEFTSNVESTELSMEVTDSLDLGTVPEGETVTEEIEVENTGDVTIQALDFGSAEMSVNGETAEIGPDAIETLDLEMSEITGDGSVTVTAESTRKEKTEEIEVQVETVPDLEEDAGELRDEINTLQGQVSSSENQNILNSASLNVTEIQNEYNAGDYERAQSIYEATEASLEEVRSSMNTEETDTVENSTEPAPNPESSTDSGGSMLPLIAVIVFVLLLIGFVVYTSYVPEEGDPLYGVLGK